MTAAATLGLVRVPKQATRMVGYVRVSTEDQGRSGLGLEAQEAAIRHAASERGWELVGIERDVASGGSRRRRPGLAAALDRCRAGEVDGLVAAKLDRLSRSLLDFAEIVSTSQRGGWRLVVLSPELTFDDAAGKLVANVLAAVAEWERDAISERTRDALAAAKARGVQLGRRPLLPEPVLDEVVRLRRRGLSLRQVASQLNGDDVPAPAGGRWDHAAVRRVLLRATRAQPAG